MSASRPSTRLEPHYLAGRIPVFIGGVLLLSRIREKYLRTRDASGSVAAGLAKTARVITATAIMVVVFLAFVAPSEVAL